jgi:hypothetical protein
LNHHHHRHLSPQRVKRQTRNETNQKRKVKKKQKAKVPRMTMAIEKEIVKTVNLKIEGIQWKRIRWTRDKKDRQKILPRYTQITPALLSSRKYQICLELKVERTK